MTNERINKSDDTLNYEISKRIRETRKPMAVLNRLSVAAVIDGKYEFKVDEQGTRQRIYLPRPAEEMKQFEDIVIKAMGYNEDRSDQVSMECFPFASIGDMEMAAPDLTGWRMVQNEYGRLIANLLLVLGLFLFVIRPIIKTVKDIIVTVEQEALPSPEEIALLDEEDKEPEFSQMDGHQQREFLEMMTEAQKEEFLKKMTASDRIQYLNNLSVSEKAKYYANKDLFKTVNIIKGWVRETEEA
jgi:flagellar M-ring protein FliF